ncbi:tyrosine-protein kinase TXK isoform X1 [Macrobrachium rosenbergii]|uniref:tyrosine-protein kinase TXK isoform X1 n=1 Tax=Macrobrachium rosenbergii TaxID=79674 RepID=UPI0034D71FD8
MKGESSVAAAGAHPDAMRTLSLQPPKIASHLDLLSDPLAALRAPPSPSFNSAHARVSAARSLRGVFQARLNGPLGSLQPALAHRPQNTSAALRSPRSVKRLAGKHSRTPRARSQPGTDKENVARALEDEDEGFEDVWAGIGRDESPRIVVGDVEGNDSRWAGDLTRLTSALDQLAALCNAPHKRPPLPSIMSSRTAPSSPTHPTRHAHSHALGNGRTSHHGSSSHGPTSLSHPFSHHHHHHHEHQSQETPNAQPVNISPTCPVHGSQVNGALTSLSLADGDSSSSNRLAHPLLQETDSGGSSGVHAMSSPPSPIGAGSGGGIVGSTKDISGGMARKVSVALRALGGRLAAWGRGNDGSQGSCQLSSSSSSSSSPVACRHSGQPTPSPTPDARSEMMPGTPGGRFKPPERQRKVVVALYDYNAIDPGDIPLRKHEEFEVIEDTQEYWWKMKNLQTGVEGFAPSNYVREKETLGLHQYDWYLGDATRQRAEVFLMQQEREGCFVVRNSTTNSGIYTLSLFSKRSHPQVKHYHIKKDAEGNYYLSHNIKCQTIPDLIFRHQHNPAGLPVRLRPPTHGRHAPTIPGPHPDKWEIDPNELNLLEELGSGQFGVVRHGKLRNLDVAVKMMKEGTMSENDFIEEAQVMTKLRHPNLVQLYGVCSMYRPIYIVTEYLKNGSLLNYLRSKDKVLLNNNEILLDMCLQVCEGMAYLERQKFIHRDLAARNCLVGAHGEIKVGDFGLARHVVDDEYTGSGGAKFPIKWAAPEVLNFMRFSSKSDVWAYGVLMWEVFSCGKMPYGKAKNTEVVEMVVQKGCVLDKPRFCPDNVYNVMRKCWDRTPEMRPAFSDIIRIFQDE